MVYVMVYIYIYIYIFTYLFIYFMGEWENGENTSEYNKFIKRAKEPLNA